MRCSSLTDMANGHDIGDDTITDEMHKINSVESELTHQIDVLKKTVAALQSQVMDLTAMIRKQAGVKVKDAKDPGPYITGNGAPPPPPRFDFHDVKGCEPRS